MEFAQTAGLSVEEARRFFPRGLSQPESGFRFSVDALLLAAFAGRGGADGLILDLGAGCGVVGLALALGCPEICVAGLDRDAEILVHARKNARRLGLEERFMPFLADVAAPGGLRAECADMVVCNPPYRREGAGRMCVRASRNPARFETHAGLEDFLRAGAFFVKNKKSCAFIYLAERVDDLLAGLCAVRLRPREMLFIHPRPGRPARLVLVRAVKNGGAGLNVLPPLFLHEEESGEFTSQTLAFCPWLRCAPEEASGSG